MPHMLLNISTPFCKRFCGINSSPLFVGCVFGDTILLNIQRLFYKPTLERYPLGGGRSGGGGSSARQGWRLKRAASTKSCGLAVRRSNYGGKLGAIFPHNLLDFYLKICKNRVAPDWLPPSASQGYFYFRLGRPWPRLKILPFLPLPVSRKQQDQEIDIDRLVQHRLDPFRHALLDEFVGGVGGHQDGDQPGKLLAGQAVERHAVHLRHDHIRQEQVDRVFTHDLQGLPAGRGLVRRKALDRQDIDQGSRACGGVVNDEYAKHGSAGHFDRSRLIFRF